MKRPAPATGRPGMLDRPLGLAAAALLGLGVGVIFPIGTLVGTLVLAVAGAKSRLFRRLLVAPGAPRWSAALTGISLLLAGLVILRLIVPGGASDNAWLAVVLPGIWLLILGTAAVAVSALPAGPRGAGMGAVLLVFVVYGTALVVAFAFGAVLANERDLNGREFRWPVRQAFALFLAAWLANLGLHGWLARRAAG